MIAVLVAGASLAPPAAFATGDEGPGWLGLVEGEATLERAGVQKPAEEDRPLLPGDRLTTAPDSRVEVVLADDTVAFVAGDADLVFAALAGVGDDGDRNLLLLERGELLLASDGETETRIDTHNASVYLGPGSYRIERDDDSTLVIARRGKAELRTRQGVVWVGAQEQGLVEGDGIPTVARAGTADTLERWAAELGERGSRGERWAFEDDGELGLGYDDFGFGFWNWDDGGSVCVRGCGGAAVRTRPPHPPAGPSSAEDPGRVVSVGHGPDDVGDAIEIAIDKPWPLDDAGGSETVETPVEKPAVDAMPEEASVDGAFLDTNDAASTDSKPADAEPASFDAEPVSSSTDTSSSDPGSASDSAPAQDSPSVSEPPADSSPSPAADAPSEPNR